MCNNHTIVPDPLTPPCCGKFMLWFGMLWCGQPWPCRLRFRWDWSQITYDRNRKLPDIIFGVMIPFIYAAPGSSGGGCGCLVTLRDTLIAFRAYRLRTRLLRALSTLNGPDDHPTNDTDQPADGERAKRDCR